MTETKFRNGRGLDVGTGFLVEARATAEGADLVTKSVRDSFLELKPANKMVLATMKKSLLKSGVSFFEDGESLIILGQDSLFQSVERQVTLQRPMAKGVISPSEAKALPMFKALIKELLGAPQVPNEKVMFTVPAAPVDGHFDVIYHSAVIESILAELGFKGTAINEAHALAFSELGDDDYTGITISMGSGMTNVAISNIAELVCKFSVAKGGDYIDQSTAMSLGYDPSSQMNTVTPNLVTLVKESGVDILNPDKDKIHLGIAAHYKELIRYVVRNIALELGKQKNLPRFSKPIPVVVAGGTSLAHGVLDLLREELNDAKLPFEISEVRHSQKPLPSVAEGCLLALLSEEA